MQRTTATRKATLSLHLRSLEAFVAVVEAGSVTAAARRLGVTQPAVSMALRELESTLGSQLVDRDLRPLRPTQPGRVLYRRATQLLADAEGMRLAVQLATADTLPSIRLGLVVSVTATGAPLIKALQRMADELRVSSGLTPELARSLAAREVDLLVTSDPMEDLENLERRTVLQEPFVLALPRGAERRLNAPTLRAVAEAMPLVRYTNRSIIGTTIERHLRRSGVDAPHRLEFDSSGSVMAMVAAGLGWAISTPLCIVQGGTNLRDVAVLPLPGAALVRTLYLVNRKGEFPGAAERIREVTATKLQELLRSSFTGELRWLLKEVAFE